MEMKTVETRKIRCKTALSESGLPGLTYALNPYFGCGHGCIYCYAPSVFRKKEVAESWGKVVNVKENIADVLRAEVLKKQKGTVGISTVTDPYQPAEAGFKLTRKCLEILLSHGFPVSIQTKSALVLRDLDILSAAKNLADVGFTITTMDPAVSKLIEPGASLPGERAAALERISEAGIGTWIFLGPVIPGLNDSEESIRQVIEVARETKSRIMYDKLNLRRFVTESMSRFTDIAPILQTFRSPGYWQKTSELIEKICRDAGVSCEPAFP